MFREMRRFKQQLPFHTCQEILSKQKRAVLSVLGDEGYPYGVPVNYWYDPSRGELGTIFIHCAVTGHKLDAIAACDKVSFCVLDNEVPEEGSWWYHVNSVICFGRASLIEEPQALHDALFSFGQKYFPPEIDIEAEIAKSAGRVNVIQVTIEHLTGKHVREN
ncbi:MAG: pyridoxamine 5'-phosphate oxidase family protein [Coriobacteriales bacterium]|nr:pyridoxamine 5'-phosphate oxidase family protein [Coriobacteriales bacterium]